MIDQKLKAAAADALYDGDLPEFQALVSRHEGLMDHALGSGNWLHIAASTDHVEIVQWLLDQGQDPKEVTKLEPHTTPLFEALTHEKLSVARLLLNGGANPNVERLVLTPLCGTVKHRSLEAMKLLEEFGVDLHAVFQDEIVNRQINALSMAVGNRKDDVAKYLKSKGCKMPE